jgi:hypothetical protein
MTGVTGLATRASISAATIAVRRFAAVIRSGSHVMNKIVIGDPEHIRP